MLMGPTGNLITGHVLDVRKKNLERVLKDYDKQLYVEWNPNKRGRQGCWEIRRLPEQKTFLHMGSYKGKDFYVYEYHEVNMVNHIMDVEYLNFEVLTKLKKIDTWKSDDWVRDFEYEEVRELVKREKQNLDDLKYKLRYYSTLAQDYKDAVKDGYNPLDFFHGKYKS